MFPGGNGPSGGGEARLKSEWKGDDAKTPSPLCAKPSMRRKPRGARKIQLDERVEQKEEKFSQSASKKAAGGKAQANLPDRRGSRRFHLHKSQKPARQSNQGPAIREMRRGYRSKKTTTFSIKERDFIDRRALQWERAAKGA